MRARLELYSWNSFSATTTTVHKADGGAEGSGSWSTRPALGDTLASNPAVGKGYNSWDVTTAVRGNGAATFAIRQETHAKRVYWASRENSDTAIRPRLVITYSVPTSTPTPTTGPAPDEWQLVWSDEFDGTALASGKWTARDSSVDYDRACITSRPQNVFVRDGLLTLRAAKENYSCAGGTRDYTTAYLDTKAKASFTYGRFEVRAKSPTGPANSKGLWPAFWMRPDDGKNGEIDVVELPGGPQYYKASTAAIFRDYKPTKKDFRYTFPTGHPADGFHTYTTEWEPGVIRWYVDGHEIWRQQGDTPEWLKETFGADSTYKRKFHLRLNFQVGGWLGDPDTATAFPADFQVDYVRAWQRQ